MTNKNKRLSGIFIVGCLFGCLRGSGCRACFVPGSLDQSIRSVKGLRSARSKLAE